LLIQVNISIVLFLLNAKKDIIFVSVCVAKWKALIKAESSDILLNLLKKHQQYDQQEDFQVTKNTE